MSNREITTATRTIHPRALAALGEKACIVALGVARDLLDGTIPPDDLNHEMMLRSWPPEFRKIMWESVAQVATAYAKAAAEAST